MHTVKEPRAATVAAQMTQTRFTDFQANGQVLGLFTARAGENMTQSNSMVTLRDNNYRALTYQEAFVAINASPELKEALKNKWFYLEGKGTQMSGYYTINEKGQLSEGKGSVENTAYVYSGNNSLSLGVGPDDGARYYGGRFGLVGYSSPDLAAPVVLGLKLAQASQAGREATAPKMGVPDDKLKRADKQVTALEKSPLFNNSEISDVREFIDWAKTQKRQ